jgi:hypothetical protein
MVKQQKTAVIVLSILLAISIIAAIYIYTSSQSQLQQANLNISSPASVFDAKLHDLLQEHTFLLTALTRQALSNSAAYQSLYAALQNNIQEVGTLLTPVYGNNSQELVNLWNEKANIFINYSLSLKNNDPNALAYYTAAEATYQPQVVTFWTTTQNPYPVLSQTEAQQLVSQNNADLKTTIDDWNAGNYNQYYADLETTYNQAGTYADVIAQAIIQQNPQDFQ